MERTICHLHLGRKTKLRGNLCYFPEALWRWVWVPQKAVSRALIQDKSWNGFFIKVEILWGKNTTCACTCTSMRAEGWLFSHWNESRFGHGAWPQLRVCASSRLRATLWITSICEKMSSRWINVCTRVVPITPNVLQNDWLVQVLRSKIVVAWIWTRKMNIWIFFWKVACYFQAKCLDKA